MTEKEETKLFTKINRELKDGGIIIAIFPRENGPLWWTSKKVSAVFKKNGNTPRGVLCENEFIPLNALSCVYTLDGETFYDEESEWS